MTRKKQDKAHAATPSPSPEEPDPVPASSSRRRLLHWVWAGLIAALAAEMLWVLTCFLRPRRAGAAASASVVVAGPVGRFAINSVTAFPEGKFYLTRLSSGGFLALDRTCTHLGCTLPWDANEGCFRCPCHASSFDMSGAVLAPPAARPLDLYPVRIENGIVKVDTAQRIRRAEFTTSQEVHP
jgi:cytochrome b6-f complex iron-sulfur subunit